MLVILTFQPYASALSYDVKMSSSLDKKPLVLSNEGLDVFFYCSQKKSQLKIMSKQSNCSFDFTNKICLFENEAKAAFDFICPQYPCQYQLQYELASPGKLKDSPLPLYLKVDSSSARKFMITLQIENTKMIDLFQKVLVLSDFSPIQSYQDEDFKALLFENRSSLHIYLLNLQQELRQYVKATLYDDNQIILSFQDNFKIQISLIQSQKITFNMNRSEQFLYISFKVKPLQKVQEQVLVSLKVETLQEKFTFSLVQNQINTVMVVLPKGQSQLQITFSSKVLMLIDFQVRLSSSLQIRSEEELRTPLKGQYSVIWSSLLKQQITTSFSSQLSQIGFKTKPETCVTKKQCKVIKQKQGYQSILMTSDKKTIPLAVHPQSFLISQFQHQYFYYPLEINKPIQVSISSQYVLLYLSFQYQCIKPRDSCHQLSALKSHPAKYYPPKDKKISIMHIGLYATSSAQGSFNIVELQQQQTLKPQSTVTGSLTGSQIDLFYVDTKGSKKLFISLEAPLGTFSLYLAQNRTNNIQDFSIHSNNNIIKLQIEDLTTYSVFIRRMDEGDSPGQYILTISEQPPKVELPVGKKTSLVLSPKQNHTLKLIFTKHDRQLFLSIVSKQFKSLSIFIIKGASSVPIQLNSTQLTIDFALFQDKICAKSSLNSLCQCQILIENKDSQTVGLELIAFQEQSIIQLQESSTQLLPFKLINNKTKFYMKLSTQADLDIYIQAINGIIAFSVQIYTPQSYIDKSKWPFPPVPKVPNNSMLHTSISIPKEFIVQKCKTDCYLLMSINDWVQDVVDEKGWVWLTVSSGMLQLLDRTPFYINLKENQQKTFFFSVPQIEKLIDEIQIHLKPFSGQFQACLVPFLYTLSFEGCVLRFDSSQRLTADMLRSMILKLGFKLQYQVKFALNIKSLSQYLNIEVSVRQTPPQFKWLQPQEIHQVKFVEASPDFKKFIISTSSLHSLLLKLILDEGSIQFGQKSCSASLSDCLGVEGPSKLKTLTKTFSKEIFYQQSQFTLLFIKANSPAKVLLKLDIPGYVLPISTDFIDFITENDQQLYSLQVTPGKQAFLILTALKGQPMVQNFPIDNFSKSLNMHFKQLKQPLVVKCVQYCLYGIKYSEQPIKESALRTNVLESFRLWPQNPNITLKIQQKQYAEYLQFKIFANTSLKQLDLTLRTYKKLTLVNQTKILSPNKLIITNQTVFSYKLPFQTQFNYQLTLSSQDTIDFSILLTTDNRSQLVIGVQTPDYVDYLHPAVYQLFLLDSYHRITVSSCSTVTLDVQFGRSLDMQEGRALASGKTGYLNQFTFTRALKQDIYTLRVKTSSEKNSFFKIKIAETFQEDLFPQPIANGFLQYSILGPYVKALFLESMFEEKLNYGVISGQSADDVAGEVNCPGMRLDYAKTQAYFPKIQQQNNKLSLKFIPKLSHNYFTVIAYSGAKTRGYKILSIDFDWRLSGQLVVLLGLLLVLVCVMTLACLWIKSKRRVRVRGVQSQAQQLNSQ